MFNNFRAVIDFFSLDLLVLIFFCPDSPLIKSSLVESALAPYFDW